MANVRYLVTMLIFFSSSPFTLYVFISLSTPVMSENPFSFDSCSTLGPFMDCSNKQLSKVPSDLPPWIEQLKLNKNSLTQIPHFTSPSNLTHLVLGHNQITSISRTALESMVNLESLELNNNDLKEIGSNDFPSSSKLQYLNLNHNDIAKVGNGSFNGLTSLVDLKLSRNKISLLNDTFKQLSSLRNLELNKNQFTAIEGMTFQGLNSLLTLKLRQNNIEDVADGAFYGLYNLRELYLDYNKLPTISGGLLYGLELLNHLNVSYNKIQSLTNEWALCSHLKQLDISNNKLEEIAKDTFQHLTNLVLLKLDNNRISYIEDGAFKYLPSLEILDLSYNSISWLVENTNGAFSPLRSLQKLFLAGNKIAHITKNAFSGLTNLTSLDLSNNAVASIEERAFTNLPQLREVLMNSSALICDCSLSWLGSWLNDSNRLVKPNGLTCVHPPNLKKKPVQLVSPKEFVCSREEHPQPQIITHPENMTALVGNNVTLRCVANSSMDSDMTITWKRNNNRLDSVVIDEYASAQNQGMTKFSNLFLTGVSMSNTGIYQCIVSNSYGVAYSKPSQLSILVFPSIVKTPSNVVVKVGSAAKLECSATGFPIPKISWQKDDGLDFPAAQGKRMKIMNISPDEPFFIVNVRLEDAGVYTCTARNAAGFVNASATLTVLEAPSFSKSMKNKEVHYGEPAVLECLAVGSPKPKITWTKNGKPVLQSKRHFLAAENQLLVITDTVVEDSGVYECEMSNGLGSQRGQLELKIVYVTEFSYEVVVGIVILTLVLSVVITSAIWVIFIYLTRKRRRPVRTPMSPIDCKSENSSHSSKDSGTGDSTKRSYQDLLLASGNANHTSIMDSHSESPSPVPESTQPLLTTFHPMAIEGSPYSKDTLSSKSKYNHSSTLTPVHYQNKQQQLEHAAGIFCSSPASSGGIQCACLSATFKITNDVCEHVMSHCNAVPADHDVSYYGDVGKRPCSIPVPYHAAHPMCRHHPNSYLCLYHPPAQHNVSQ